MAKCCNPTNLNLRSELIDLYYDFIDNYRNRIECKKKNISLENHIKSLNKLIDKKFGKNVNSTLTIALQPPDMEIDPIYLKYLEIHGIPEDGVFDAQKLACIMEEYDLKPSEDTTENNNLGEEPQLVEVDVTEENLTSLIYEYEKIVEEIYGINIDSSYDENNS